MVKKILRKNSVFGLFLLVLMLTILTTNSVNALNGATANGKFVISNATVGDVIQRSIKVISNNSFDVIIELEPAGNLSKYIKIIDNNITMGPHSEKEFRFSVKVPQEGRNDGGINIKFTPANMTANGKNGIVIPTTMVIFAKKGSGNIDWTSWFGTNKNESNQDDPETNPQNSDSGMSLFEILFLVTAIIFIILLILLYLYSKRKNSGVKREKLNTKKSKG